MKWLVQPGLLQQLGETSSSLTRGWDPDQRSKILCSSGWLGAAALGTQVWGWVYLYPG